MESISPDGALMEDWMFQSIRSFINALCAGREYAEWGIERTFKL